MKLNAQDLEFFNLLSDFVFQLSDMFGSSRKGIRLYAELLKKTNTNNKTHFTAIRKHISIFTEYLLIHKTEIEARDYSGLNGEIRYSSKVYFSPNELFRSADKETSDVMWQHYLGMLSKADPKSNALNVLRKLAQPGTIEGDFMNQAIETIGKTLEGSSASMENPMDMLSTLLSSGAIKDLVSGMQTKIANGSLDVGKLTSSVQGFMTQMNLNPNETTDIAKTIEKMTTSDDIGVD